MDMARCAAVRALIRMHEGAFANLVVEGVFEQCGLKGKQRAFAAALFYGCAERVVTLDFFLQGFLKKPIEKMDVEVRAVLELGLYQCLYMRVPQHAAVSESVKLARALKKSSASGMVNAVLRKAAQQWQGEGNDLARFAFKDEVQRIQVMYSLSEAVAKELMASLPNEYEDYLKACLFSAETCIRVNTLKTDIDALEKALAEQGVSTRRAQTAHCLYAEFAQDVAKNPLFEQGMFHVQGQASQYVCGCVKAKGGERVLDLCAAPGGKSATLAQDMGGGSGLTACDVRQNRLPLVHQTFERLGIKGAKVLLNDASQYSAELEGQDAVLCDVPCSGLGVMAAKPDIRYSGGEGYEQLEKLQRQILQTASRYVKKGGRLVYSTCTVRKEENEDAVRDFLSANAEFCVQAPPKFEGAVSEEGMLTFLPHRTETDGFFVAILRKA